MNQCPMCGYVEVLVNKQPSNAMNIYVHPKNSTNRIVFNSAAPTVKIGTDKTGFVEYVRLDVYEESLEPKETPKTIEATVKVAPVKVEPVKPSTTPTQP